MTMASHATVRFQAPVQHRGAVLLIEDDAPLARSLVRVINSEGYDVVHVGSAAAAVDLVKSGSFDVVLSDLNLPGASGVDVLNLVRAYDPDVPLVLMTGTPTVDTAIEACNLGVLEYLVKPTPRDQLARVLGRATKARRSAVHKREAVDSQLAAANASEDDVDHESVDEEEARARSERPTVRPTVNMSAVATVPAPAPMSGVKALAATLAIINSAQSGSAPVLSEKPEKPVETPNASASRRTLDGIPTQAELPVVNVPAVPAVSADPVVAMKQLAKSPRVTKPFPPNVQGIPGESCSIAHATFERAMATLAVDLEPIADAKSKKLLGFAARMRSAEETLATDSALVVMATKLDKLETLRRRVRDMAVLAFASAPADALLFVDVHPSDLLDGDLYSPEPPLARIAERVVLQVRARGLAMNDLSARASVLRFVGFRMAIADLDAGQACLAQIADLAPEFVKIDSRLVKGLDGSLGRRRLVSALVSMCRSLDAVSIAEGVSTAEEREALLAAGCNVVQGAIAARYVPPAPLRYGMAPMHATGR